MTSSRTMKREDVIGSWHSTGFHGHFRSKTRLEYEIPYRQRAKPPPPNAFLRKSQQRSNKHTFSHHDNRHSHSDGGDLETYFRLGLGKKKYYGTENVHSKKTTELLRWQQPQAGLSTYRSSYTPLPPQVRWMNDPEPVHVRSNLNLRRKTIDIHAPVPKNQGNVPLLAWNEPSEASFSKPCVGTKSAAVYYRPQMSSSGRTISYAPCPPWAQTDPGLSHIHQSQSAVHETVSPLSLTA